MIIKLVPLLPNYPSARLYYHQLTKYREGFNPFETSFFSFPFDYGLSLNYDAKARVRRGKADRALLPREKIMTERAVLCLARLTN